MFPLALHKTVSPIPATDEFSPLGLCIFGDRLSENFPESQSSVAVHGSCAVITPTPPPHPPNLRCYLMPPIHHRDPWPTLPKKQLYLILFFQVRAPVFLHLRAALKSSPLSSKTQRVCAPWSLQFTNCSHVEVEGRWGINSFRDTNKSVHGSWSSSRYETGKIKQGTQLQFEAVINKKKCVNSNEESRKCSLSFALSSLKSICDVWMASFHSNL